MPFEKVLAHVKHKQYLNSGHNYISFGNKYYANCASIKTIKYIVGWFHSMLTLVGLFDVEVSLFFWVFLWAMI